MFIALALLAGVLAGLIDVFVIGRGKKPAGKVFTVLGDMFASNFISIFATEYLYTLKNKVSVLYLENYSWRICLLHFLFTFAIGIAWVLVIAFFDGNVFCKKESVKLRKTMTAVSIVSVILTALGMAALNGTVWSKETFGDVDPDQLIVNLFSPAEGTSSEVMDTLWRGPVLQTAAVTFLFSLFVFSTRALYLRRKDKEIRLFSVVLKKITALLLSAAILAGGIAFGIKEFQLKTLYNMSPADRKQLGDNAFAYHRQHHERNKVLKQLIDFIFE